MSFFDAEAYSAHIRDRNTLQSGYVCGLSFRPSARQLISLTTSGQLSVHDLSSIAPYATTSASVRVAAPATALGTTAAGVYVGTSDSLLRLRWGEVQPTPVFADVGVVSIAHVLDSSIICAVEAGWIMVVDEERGEAANVVGEEVGVESIASTQEDGNTVLAACKDGNLRQFDFRSGRDAVRKVQVKSGIELTSVESSSDGMFALVGDANYTLSCVHMSSSSVVTTKETQFIPRTVARSGGSFYCGGSDRVARVASNAVCVFDPFIEVVDLNCQSVGPGKTHVSATSVYAMNICAETGMMAAGGYSSNKSHQRGAGELVDVYEHPPARSYKVPL